jgi:hypothetical protein
VDEYAFAIERLFKMMLDDAYETTLLLDVVEMFHRPLVWYLVGSLHSCDTKLIFCLVCGVGDTYTTSGC